MYSLIPTLCAHVSQPYEEADHYKTKSTNRADLLPAPIIATCSIQYLRTPLQMNLVSAACCSSLRFYQFVNNKTAELGRYKTMLICLFLDRVRLVV